jgi:hypothetical protein
MRRAEIGIELLLGQRERVNEGGSRSRGLSGAGESNRAEIYCARVAVEEEEEARARRLESIV